MTSQAACVPSTNADAYYGASKTGLTDFARNLVAEFVPFGITVSSAAPGMNEASSRASQVGEVVHFLAPDAASYLTGTTIGIGGGSYMP